MLYKKRLFSLLFLACSSLAMAETVSEEEMKKALIGVTQIKVLEAQEPKIVSEVIVKERVTQTKSQRKKMVKPAKKTRTYKTKTYKKKVYKKRPYKKKVYKKREEAIDFSQLKDAQTLGVISTSEPFELNH